MGVPPFLIPLVNFHPKGWNQSQMLGGGAGACGSSTLCLSARAPWGRGSWQASIFCFWLVLLQWCI